MEICREKFFLCASYCLKTTASVKKTKERNGKTFQQCIVTQVYAERKQRKQKCKKLLIYL